MWAKLRKCGWTMFEAVVVAAAVIVVVVVLVVICIA